MNTTLKQFYDLFAATSISMVILKSAPRNLIYWRVISWVERNMILLLNIGIFFILTTLEIWILMNARTLSPGSLMHTLVFSSRSENYIIISYFRLLLQFLLQVFDENDNDILDVYFEEPGFKWDEDQIRAYHQFGITPMLQVAYGKLTCKFKQRDYILQRYLTDFKKNFLSIRNKVFAQN